MKCWRWARRNPWFAGLAGVAGVLLIAGIAGLFLSNAMLGRKNAEISRQRNRARQAVDKWFTQVAERLLPNVPGMETTRREFLIEARRYYEQEAAEGNGSDRASRIERANARFRVGRIQDILGDNTAAGHAYGEVITLLDQLVKDDPREANVRLLLAGCLKQLGLVHWTRGRRPEAERLFRRALDTAADAPGALADQPEFRDLMARILHNLAIVQQETNHLPDAESSMHQAVETHRKLLAKAPDSAVYRHVLVEDLGVLAGLLKDPRWPRPRWEGAEQAFHEALEIAEKLPAETSSGSDHLALVAALRNNLGEFLTQRGRFKEAEAVLRQAVSDREKIAARWPDVPDHQAHLGAAVNCLAESLCGQGRYAEACDLAKRAITHNQAALNASPTHSLYLAWLRNDYVTEAEALLSQGDSKKSSEVAEAAIRLLPDDPLSFSCLAVAYARCVPNLEKNPKLNGAQRRALILSTVDRAVGHLRTAFPNGDGRMAKSLQEDRDLQSLRPFECFQRLIREWDGK